LFPLAPCLLAQAQEPQQQSAEPSSNAPAAAKPKKVWTNENISSTSGTISVVGGSEGGASDQASRHSEAFSNGATIMSPQPGSIVHPGETLHVEVALDPGVTLMNGMIVVMGLDAMSEPRKSAPYSFTLTVPSEESGGSHLIGFHTLGVAGAIVGRKNGADLAAIDVDVEEPDLPLDIRAVGNYGPWNGPPYQAVQFSSIGMDETPEIYGKFPGGREVDVTQSTHLSLVSGDPSVAHVLPDGRISSVGPGNTTVVYTYSLGAERKQVFVPVHVEVEATCLFADPAVVDFGDQTVGTKSAPRRITLTDKCEWPIKIGTLTGGFFRDAENCSNTTLPPGGQCSITFTFSPATAGPDHDILYISNTADGQHKISFFGNGI
jgi:hypothetical protein